MISGLRKPTGTTAIGRGVRARGPTGMGRFGSVTWTLADQAIVSASNFLTIYLLARFMEVGEFGAFMVGWISLLFLVSLQSAVISEPHNVLGPRLDPVRYRQLTSVLAKTLLEGSLALGALLAAAGAVTWAIGSPRWGGLLLLLGGVVVAWMAQEFVRRALYTRSEIRSACANDALSYGLQAGGIAVVAATVQRPSMALAFGVLGSSSLVAALVGAWQIRGHLGSSGVTPEVERGIRADAFGFGKWLLARNVVSWSGQYGHNWLLLAMLGPAALGTYKAAEHLLNVVNPLRLAAYNYLPPRGSRVHAEGGLDALRHWVRGVYRLVGGAFMGAVLVLMLFSAPLLDLAYGDKFAGLHLEWVIVLAGVAAMVNFARIPLEMAIAAMKQSRPLFWIHVWSVPLLFAVGTALIHRFGIFGLPVSSTVIGGVLLVLTLRAFHGVSAAEIQRAPPRAAHGARSGCGAELLVADGN